MTQELDDEYMIEDSIPTLEEYFGGHKPNLKETK